MTSKKSKSRRDDCITIPEFFSGKSVFVTGATGFMGKVLMEKLLRSCPNVEKIYILLRPKKGKTLEERLAQLVSLPLFVKVKREDDTALKKIIPLKGDVSEKNLGLSEEDQRTLIQEVSVVFHVAASVRFDDPLKTALLLNTRGTYETLKLAKEMKKLESFLHVSTTYCNTHKDVLEETVYPPPGDWRQLIKLAETLDKETLDVFAPKILGAYPNTYTYTKGLAEHIVKEFSDDLPAVIFRPSIVIGSYLEPVPGWVDNFNGPVGLIVASGKGIVRTIYSDSSISADYCPVDVAIKALIVTAWNRATERELDRELPVYNCSSYGIKSITQKELVQLASHVTKAVPLNDMIWYPGADVTACKFRYYIEVLLLHLLPALIVDTVLKLNNKKPMLLKIQRKIYVANMALAYFLSKQWTFKNNFLLDLDNKLLEKDRAAFSFRVDDVDVIEYFTNCAYGAREYLLKEDNTELPEARAHQQKMYWIDKATKTAFLLLMAYIAVKLQYIQTLRIFLVNMTNLFINFFI